MASSSKCTRAVAHFCSLGFLVDVSINTVEQFARLLRTLRNKTKGCILRWANPPERGKCKALGQVHGRQGLEGQTNGLLFLCPCTLATTADV
jgi:hypothetical protein